MQLEVPTLLVERRPWARHGHWGRRHHQLDGNTAVLKRTPRRFLKVSGADAARPYAFTANLSLSLLLLLLLLVANCCCRSMTQKGGGLPAAAAAAGSKKVPVCRLLLLLLLLLREKMDGIQLSVGSAASAAQRQKQRGGGSSNAPRAESSSAASMQTDRKLNSKRRRRRGGGRRKEKVGKVKERQFGSHRYQRWRSVPATSDQAHISSKMENKANPSLVLCITARAYGQ
mmetsp:Transcript_51279/g.101575  ORF Transcript_51279/g.101575 Transcript_51279/m.101575 type:complete len:229 (+) Transcript_51279:468-1154(+)